MHSGSFLELTLTIYAWQVSNRLTELIVQTGLIFLPLFWLLWKNWSQPTRSQEAKNAAPVSLRRMEQDIVMMFFALILAFIPFVNIAATEVRYHSPITDRDINAADELERNGGDPEASIKVPALWWAVHQLSAGLSGLMTDAVYSFATPQHYRAIALALDYSQIHDPQLRAELRAFDHDCYLPALAKLEGDNDLNESPQWRGDEVFFRSGYYDDEFKATRSIPAWVSRYDWANNREAQGHPRCAEWWRHPDLGLRSRMHAMIAAELESADYETSKGFLDWLGTTPTEHRQDLVLKKFLSRYPPPNVNQQPTNDEGGLFGFVNFSLTDNIAAIGSLLGYAIVRVTNSMIQIGLPMIQALVLAIVYIAIPVAIPFACLKPGVIVFFAGAIFSLKMLSGLWAIAAFIDEKIIEIMYGDGFLSGSGNTADLVLMMITGLSYIGIPMIWIWLMSSMLGNATTGVNSFFTSTSARMDAVGQQTTMMSLSKGSAMMGDMTKKMGQKMGQPKN